MKATNIARVNIGFVVVPEKYDASNNIPRLIWMTKSLPVALI